MKKMSRLNFKVVLLGDAYVGKTSLVLRYLNGYFNGAMPYQTTIGAIFCTKIITYNGQDYSLGIWDTAGSKQYMAMTEQFYRGAHAALLCYDACKMTSWERLLFWLREVRSREPADLLGASGENRTVPMEAVNRVARDHAGHFEVSNKTGQGVDELFQKICEDCANDQVLMEAIERNMEERIVLDSEIKNATVDKTGKCWC